VEQIVDVKSTMLLACFTSIVYNTTCSRSSPRQYSIDMRPSIRLLATPTSPKVSLKPNTRPPPLALLPPLPLYRRLLRLHRKKLDAEERVFGDTYLKAEFRRHKDIENPLHIVGFLTQWQIYGQKLSGDDWRGDMNKWVKGQAETGQKVEEGEWAMEHLLDRMNDQQIGQVWELYNAIRERGRDSVDEEDLVRQAQMQQEDDRDKS
jgi:hypothetical protein